MELLGQNARAIGSVMEQNLGGTTTIIVDKQETDYLNQQRNDDNQAEEKPSRRDSARKIRNRARTIPKIFFKSCGWDWLVKMLERRVQYGD